MSRYGHSVDSVATLVQHCHISCCCWLCADVSWPMVSWWCVLITLYQPSKLLSWLTSRQHFTLFSCL